MASVLMATLLLLAAGPAATLAQEGTFCGSFADRCREWVDPGRVREWKPEGGDEGFLSQVPMTGKRQLWGGGCCVWSFQDPHESVWEV